MSELYMQRRQKGRTVEWWYMPPHEYIKAGAVKRQRLTSRKDTATNEARRLNMKLNEWLMDKPEFNPKLSALTSAYLNSRTYDNLSVHSQKQYRQCIDWLADLIGDVDYEDVDREMAQGLYDQLLETRTVRMADRIIAVHRAIYRWGIKKGYVNNNPFILLDIQRPMPPNRVWTREQVTTYLTAAYSHFSTRNLGLIAQLVYELGIKVMDARNLTWDMYDHSSRTLTVPASTRRTKVVYQLSDNLYSVLEQQRNDFGWQKWVAPNINIKVDNGYAQFAIDIVAVNHKKLLAKTTLPKGLKLSDLRRSAILEMKAMGMSDEQVQAYLGWTANSEFKRYMRELKDGCS